MLLIKPAPGNSESLRGYLLRLADANGIPGLRSLFELIEETPSEKELAAVAAFLGRNAGDFELLSGIVPKADGSHGGLQHSHGLPIRFWNTGYARFCPKCLEEFDFWQSHWELALVVACSFHRVRLVDQCPKCQREIRWHRKYFMQCDCGQALTEITAPPCTEVEAWVSARQICCLSSEKPRGDDVLKSLGLNDLTSLLWFVGGYASGIASKPLKIGGVYRMEVALRLVRAAGDMFTCWPTNFHHFIYELGGFDRNTNSSAGLMRRFGFFYHSLYSNFQGEQFRFLHKAFEAFLREHWPGALARRNRRLSDDLILEHRMLPLPKVAKELRVSRTKLRQMIAHGQLSASTRTTPSGRVFISIDRDSMLRIQAQQADWITFTEARNLLGLSKKRFRCLLEMDVVKAMSGPKVDGSVVWRFSRALIETMKRSPEDSTMLTNC